MILTVDDAATIALLLVLGSCIGGLIANYINKKLIVLGAWIGSFVGLGLAILIIILKIEM